MTTALHTAEQVKALADQGWPHWWIRPKGETQWVYERIHSTRYMHYAQGNVEYFGPITPPPEMP